MSESVDATETLLDRSIPRFLRLLSFSSNSRRRPGFLVIKSHEKQDFLETGHVFT